MKVKVNYSELWYREAEWDVDLLDVQEWAAKRDQDPADVEVTAELLVEYFQSEFDNAGPDLPGWHPGGEGLPGYDFDSVTVSDVLVQP